MTPRRSALVWTALASALILAATGTARAGLVINPIFDGSITSDPNAAAIESTINTAIYEYETRFSDPITVNITFKEMSTGLGRSDTQVDIIPYTTYVAALIADRKTGDDATALAHLPIQATSPADGQTNIYVTTANERAIGIAAPVPVDGTVSFNESIVNNDRLSINGGKYDLKAVLQHEIDEVFGFGSGLDLLGNTNPALSRPEDFFRYSAPGVRSYSLARNAGAYFSIDGGVTNLINLNGAGGGTDYGDYAGPFVNVQNAFGIPGATPDLNVELRMLDVIGYDLTSGFTTTTTPEPSTIGLAAMAVSVGLGAWIRGRRRTRTIAAERNFRFA